MGVAVYPRLGELLRQRGLSVAELERQIEWQYGISVDAKTLYRLTHAEAIQRADLEIAGAAAAVLGVGLGDLFDVQAVPTALADEPTGPLDPHEGQRMADLLDQQANQGLSTAERHELEALVGEYGRRLHERSMREYAAQRGIPVEQAHREAAAQLEEAVAWWREFEADPARRQALVAEAKRRQARRSE